MPIVCLACGEPHENSSGDSGGDGPIGFPPMDRPWPIEIVMVFVGAKNKDEIYQMVHRGKLPAPMADGRKRSWWWPPTLYYWRRRVIKDALDSTLARNKSWGLDDHNLKMVINAPGLATRIFASFLRPI